MDELRRRDFADLARGDASRLAAAGKVVNLDKWHRFAYTRKMAAPPRPWSATPPPGPGHRWWTSQIDGRWAEQLRPDLVDPAWVALYLSSVVTSGPWWNSQSRATARRAWPCGGWQASA